MPRVIEPTGIPSQPFNLVLPTFGGKQLWADVYLYGGYRIQVNVVSRTYRLLDPRDVRLAWGSFEHTLERFHQLRKAKSVQRHGKHLVLMLHGIFRSKDSFLPMARALQKSGYEAHAVNYPSTQRGVAVHADQIEELLDLSEDIDTVSFVTHSMGGLVARHVLGRPDASWRQRIRVNRLVMIATPNQGAEIARMLYPLNAFRVAAGPAADDLVPEAAHKIPVPDCEFGVIAGGKGDGRGFNPLLPGDDDLTVTVQSTELHGMRDHLVVPAMHTFIMAKPRVITATQHFLENGRFG